jgi:hypothetical protein
MLLPQISSLSIYVYSTKRRQCATKRKSSHLELLGLTSRSCLGPESKSREMSSRETDLAFPRETYRDPIPYHFSQHPISLTEASEFYTMASAPRKPPASTQAEVALLPSLKNCLLNLPASLVNVLSNSNAVVQNVVVELSFRQVAGSDGKPGKQQSVFLGWTGMRSQTRRAGPRQEQEVAGVEVDGTFGRLLGLREGMKVCFFSCFCFPLF